MSTSAPLVPSPVSKKPSTIKMRAISFPAGGYSEGSIIYALIFGDSSIYIGKNGSSNNTGSSLPYERLATHLRKKNKTKSALHGQDMEELRNEGFKFCYAFLPENLIHEAGEIERMSIVILRGTQHSLHNGAARKPKTISAPAVAFAEQFAKAVENAIPG